MMRDQRSIIEIIKNDNIKNYLVRTELLTVFTLFGYMVGILQETQAQRTKCARFQNRKSGRLKKQAEMK